MSNSLALAAPSSADWRDWIALTKPRVMSLVVFTGFIGLWMAPGHIDPVSGLAAILAIALASGGAGSINMWYDRDIDGLMRRTANRPVPMGRIDALDALGFGVVLSGLSVMLMGLAANWLAAFLLAVSIGYYVGIYTMWLKRRTPFNIVIGGAAGAFPPVVGWAAVTGSVDLLPLLMFVITFFWTPPHFWSLALYAEIDYERAGVPMLPVVAGARETRKQILIYTLLLLPISLLPYWLGLVGRSYGVVVALLGLGFVVHAVRVWRDQCDASGASALNDKPARRAFRFSLVYLAVLYVAFALDGVIRSVT
jgi:protoheme IX farnesyltransferase